MKPVAREDIYETKPEQVKFFEELMTPYLAGRSEVDVLDACCGLGDLTFYLSQLNRQARFVGIDKAGFLLEEAKKYFLDNPNVSFQISDIYDVSRQLGSNRFDITVCKQTLSWLPGYQDAVVELMAVTKEAVFASSLFYDGLIDFEIRTVEYRNEEGERGYDGLYNVYSFPVFRRFCIEHGAKDVLGFDFNIQIDLPRPTTLDKMGTYTHKLETGERIQVSGALLMPWKIVRIDL